MLVGHDDRSRYARGGTGIRGLIAVWSLLALLPSRYLADDGPILIGAAARSEVEAALPGWVEEAMSMQPDLDSTARLSRAIVGAQVVVYLGTWCDDSRRELARLWWALDSLGLDELPQLSYVGVDRALREPAELLEGVDLIRVPTFVVRRGGVELGRVVEESPHGIEVDLLALLSGEASGSLTASEDLLMEQGETDR